jgi:hypothetical protein
VLLDSVLKCFCLLQAASRNDLEGLLSVVETAGESFDDKAVESALRQVHARA